MLIVSDEPTTGIALLECEDDLEQLVEEALQAPDLEVSHEPNPLSIMPNDPNWGRVWGRTFSGIEAS